MKINLISAFMRGDEIFSIRSVSPFAVTVYNKLVAVNNRLGWKTIIIETDIKSLSEATHMRPTSVQKGLEELKNLSLILVKSQQNLEQKSAKSQQNLEQKSAKSQQNLEQKSAKSQQNLEQKSAKSQQKMNIILLPKERSDAVIQNFLQTTLNDSIAHSMTDRQTDSHADRQVKQAVSQSAQNNQPAGGDGGDGSDGIGEGKIFVGVDTNDPAVIERRIQIYDNYKALKGEELVNKALHLLADQGIFFPTTEIFVQKLEFVEKVSKTH